MFPILYYFNQNGRGCDTWHKISKWWRGGEAHDPWHDQNSGSDLIFTGKSVGVWNCSAFQWKFVLTFEEVKVPMTCDTYHITELAGPSVTRDPGSGRNSTVHFPSAAWLSYTSAMFPWLSCIPRCFPWLSRAPWCFLRLSCALCYFPHHTVGSIKSDSNGKALKMFSTSVFHPLRSHLHSDSSTCSLLV